MSTRRPYRPNLLIDGFFVIKSILGFIGFLVAWQVAEKRLPSRQELIDAYRWHYAITFLMLAIPRATGDPDDLCP